MRGHHDRLPGATPGAGDQLLNPGNMFHRKLHPQIAARDHQAVGDIDNLIEAVERFWLFDLRHNKGTPIDDLFNFGNVIGALHKGQRDPVHIQRQREIEIAPVLGGKGRYRQNRIGDIDALVRRE